MWVRVPGGELHSIFLFLSFFLRVIFYQFEPAGNGSDNTFSIQDVTSGLVEKISKNRHNRLYQLTELIFFLVAKMLK